jgi:hypothetical protein
MKTVNLKEGMPLVRQALMQMDRELAVARAEGCGLVKLIHGYGSTGAGGEIRIAVQNRLREMSERGEIRGFIFGENWTKIGRAGVEDCERPAGTETGQGFGER